MRFFIGSETLGVVFRERWSLVIGLLPVEQDYSTDTTCVCHVRLFGLVFAFASWDPDDPR